MCCLLFLCFASFFGFIKLDFIDFNFKRFYWFHLCFCFCTPSTSYVWAVEKLTDSINQCQPKFCRLIVKMPNKNVCKTCGWIKAQDWRAREKQRLAKHLAYCKSVWMCLWLLWRMYFFGCQHWLPINKMPIFMPKMNWVTEI